MGERLPTFERKRKPSFAGKPAMQAGSALAVLLLTEHERIMRINFPGMVAFHMWS